MFNAKGQRLFIDRSRALHAAVHGWWFGDHQADAVRVLLEAGADPNPRDSKGATPLFSAAGAKSVPCGCELLKGGAEPTVAVEGTPLHVAALGGSTDVISLLLAASPGSINVQDGMGLSPLAYAAMGDDPVTTSQALHCLLSAGASDTEVAFRDGRSSLLMSVETENEVTLRIMLNHIKAVRGYDAVPAALCRAVVKGNARLLRLLLLVEGDEGQERWARLTVSVAGTAEPILHLAARSALSLWSGSCCRLEHQSRRSPPLWASARATLLD